MDTNLQTGLMLAVLGYGAYVFWPNIKKLIPSLPSIGKAKVTSGGDAFEAFQLLQKKASELEGTNKEAATKCLCDLLVPLFGSPDLE